MGKNEYIPSQEHVNIIWVYGLPIYIALIRHVLDSKESTLANLVCNFAVHEAFLHEGPVFASLCGLGLWVQRAPTHTACNSSADQWDCARRQTLGPVLVDKY